MARTSAVSDEGSCTASTSSRRSDRFLKGLEQASRVTFVSHVHPDPDSLGSMMGLSHLVESCLGIPTRLTRDGLISRLRAPDHGGGGRGFFHRDFRARINAAGLGALHVLR